MGDFHLNSDKIQNFEVKLVKETVDALTFDVVHMRIVSGALTVTYRIVSDDRNPDINRIRNDLDAGLTQAMNSNAPFGVNEYLERSYIFVNYPNGQSGQYTAQRIG